MRRFLPTLILLALVPIAFWAGRTSTRGPAPPPGGRKVLYYVDPMNPAFRSPEPGTAPCGMPLEPVYADGTGGGAQGAALPAGAVQVRPDRQQLIGVRTEKAGTRALNRGLRLLGRVAPDERRVFRLNSVTAGWVRDVSGPTTGSVVRKGELLGTYYSQELLGPQQAFVYALDAYDRFKAAGADEMQIEINERNVANARQVLVNLGMSEIQVDAIAASRKTAPLLEMRAPGAGVLLSRNVALGQRFDPTTELFAIADLSHVWVLADLFERDADALRPGVRARVSAPALGRTFEGVVSRSLPQFDPDSRTLKARLEVANPGLPLRPGMFVDVTIDVPAGEPGRIVVPATAVLDSGTRRTVFVERGPGIFEPRPVETGRRTGTEVEILSGLAEGETVVVSGNFLLDSESRMRTAGAAPAAAAEPTAGAEPVAAAAKDPVCHMDVDPAAARADGLVAEVAGTTYYFCNPACRTRFLADPAAFPAAAARPAP